LIGMPRIPFGMGSMTGYLDHKSRGALKSRSVITYVTRRCINIFSFLLTRGEFTATLILILGHRPW
jgi:hypothetical protein